MTNVGISREEIKEAILCGDTAKIAGMLSEFHLSKHQNYPPYASSKSFLTMLLTANSAAIAKRGVQHPDLDRELIEFSATIVSIFPLLDLIAMITEITAEDSVEISEKLLTALSADFYIKQAADDIEKLSKTAFGNLLVWMIQDLDKLIPAYNPPIIHCLYKFETIPHQLLFAYMAAHLVPSAEENLGYQVMAAAGGKSALVDVRPLVSAVHPPITSGFNSPTS